MNTKREQGEICHLLWSVVTFVLVSCWGSKEQKTLWMKYCMLDINNRASEAPRSPGLSSMHKILEGNWVNWLGLWNTSEWQHCLRQDTGPFRPQGNCVTGKVPQLWPEFLSIPELFCSLLSMSQRVILLWIYINFYLHVIHFWCIKWYS